MITPTAVKNSSVQSSLKLPKRRSRLRLWLSITMLACASVVLAACGQGAGTQEEFVDVLTRDGNLSNDEADCVADAVFAEYGEDDEALKKISLAQDYESLERPLEEGGLPGFDSFLTETVTTCTTFGPVSDG